MISTVSRNVINKSGYFLTPGRNDQRLRRWKTGRTLGPIAMQRIFSATSRQAPRIFCVRARTCTHARRRSGSILWQHIRGGRGETVADIMTHRERMGAAAWVGLQHPVQGTDPAWISKSSLPLTLRLIFKSWLQSMHTRTHTNTGAWTHTQTRTELSPCAPRPLVHWSLPH